jgi:hypothetical protein
VRAWRDRTWQKEAGATARELINLQGRCEALTTQLDEQVAENALLVADVAAEKERLAAKESSWREIKTIKEAQLDV